jgi:hypothetical protein
MLCCHRALWRDREKDGMARWIEKGPSLDAETALWPHQNTRRAAWVWDGHLRCALLCALRWTAYAHLPHARPVTVAAVDSLTSLIEDRNRKRCTVLLV